LPSNKAFKKPLLVYFIATYLAFWLFLTFTAVLVLVFKAPAPVQYILPVISSWTPTVMFFLLFKRLGQEISIKEFLKKQFCTRMNAFVLIAILVSQIFILAVVLFSRSAVKNVPLSSLLSVNASSVMICFFDNLVRGPIGEEIGWRGYALNELQKKHSALSSAVILGCVWGFWHAPLWFLTSGYSGAELLRYIVFFLIGIISTSVIMTAFYNLNKNLLIPMIIHLLYNFTLAIPAFYSLDKLACFSILYLIFAIVLILANPKKVLHAKG
jgi:CAAX amino terminal protease family.